MRKDFIGLGLAAAAALLGSEAGAETRAEHSTACWHEADVKGLTGHARSRFHATCVQGALGTTRPTSADTHSKAAQVLLAPSGADRTVRSKQCTAEADRKSTDENQRKSIRLACLASAAPPGATGTPTHPPTPTPAKPGYDELPR